MRTFFSSVEFKRLRRAIHCGLLPARVDTFEPESSCIARQRSHGSHMDIRVGAESGGEQLMSRFTSGNELHSDCCKYECDTRCLTYTLR